MAAAERIRGIFVPNMVPLDDRENINEAELRLYVDWMIDRGVHGLYPNGSTSEFTRFTPPERRRIIEIVVEQTAGRVPILAGAAEANVRETLGACEYYARLGVRAVAIVSPFYYRLSPDNVYAYFKEIGRHTPVDVTLYNIPMFASPIDVPTVQRLAEECPRIVAIKDSSGDLTQMMRMIEAVRPIRPDFSFLTGWDSVLMPMLVIGCDGGTNATAGVVPEITRKIYDLTLAGRIDEARGLQYKLRKVFDLLLYSADFPEGVRAALAIRGFRMGAGRQPLSDKHRQALEQMHRTLWDLLATEGYPCETPGACGPEARAGFDPAHVDRIVDDVVAALKSRGVVQ
jgi:dihydrodipicolinate synthase/N-acetylneuraminate lyase